MTEHFTYEIVVEIWMHVVNTVVHDGCRHALSSITECPGRLDIQIEFWDSAGLTGVVLWQ